MKHTYGHQVVQESNCLATAEALGQKIRGLGSVLDCRLGAPSSPSTHSTFAPSQTGRLCASTAIHGPATSVTASVSSGFSSNASPYLTEQQERPATLRRRTRFGSSARSSVTLGARGRKVWGRKLGLRATYHDACQSANVLGIGKAPRALLREVAGVEIVEMAESSICCGFGGSFSFEFPEVANRVLERKLANIEATGVDLVIADNPGCLTHLRGALDARRKETRVRHLAEVLWESLS